MYRKFVASLALAAALPLAAAQAEPLQSAELAALVGKSGFEFRGHQTMWKFSPDGRVTADDNVYRGTQGAMGETWGLKNAGTWRLEGQTLCIRWQNAAGDQCYTVTRLAGRMVRLSGPRMIDGTFDPRDDTGFAETPAPPAPATPPGYRYQRIPGPR